MISPLKYAFVASHTVLLGISGVWLMLKNVLICVEMCVRKLTSVSNNGSSLQCCLVCPASGRASTRTKGVWSEIIILS